MNILQSKWWQRLGRAVDGLELGWWIFFLVGALAVIVATYFSR